MTLWDLVLIVVLVSALFGRGHLALGVVFDFFIALLVIALIYRIIDLFVMM